MLREIQLLSDLCGEMADGMRDRCMKAGIELAVRCQATNRSGRFQYQDLLSAFGQVRRTDQSIVSSADND